MNETIQLTLIAKEQSKKLRKARQSLQVFQQNVNKTEAKNRDISYTHVSKISKHLLVGFSNINYTLECYRRKVIVINRITRKCASGEDTYENLWEIVKNEQGNKICFII